MLRRILSRWAGCLVVVLTAPGLCHGANVVKSATDLEGLKVQAQRSKRLVLLFITSSDPGCWQCKKIGKDFFADREFTEWVDRHTVYGELDMATKPDGPGKICWVPSTHDDGWILCKPTSVMAKRPAVFVPI